MAAVQTMPVPVCIMLLKSGHCVFTGILLPGRLQMARGLENTSFESLRGTCLARSGADSV